jgi:small ligand-binding sensory domain FIST
VSDEASADEDLRNTLKAARGTFSDRGIAGGLLLACNGRGSHMFSTPDHDAALLATELGRPSNCRLLLRRGAGPVGNKNILHGFTASMALFSGDPKTDR